jgi:hypothetical protein
LLSVHGSGRKGGYEFVKQTFYREGGGGTTQLCSYKHLYIGPKFKALFSRFRNVKIVEYLLLMHFPPLVFARLFIFAPSTSDLNFPPRVVWFIHF